MALRVRSKPLGPVQANCYVLWDEDTRAAAVIDPGTPDPWVLEQVKDLEVRYVLLTHAHFDHIGGVDAVRRATGAPVLIHPAERDWLADPALNGSAYWEAFTGRIVAGPPDGSLEDGQLLELGPHRIEVRHTPGHSPGGVSLVVGDLCFSGDALFFRSIGRTDLPFADHEQLIRSIRTRLLSLPDRVRVLPGHGPQTTIGEEREFNPFLRDEERP